MKHSEQRFPIPTRPQEDLEQALSLIWTHLEAGTEEAGPIAKLLSDEFHPGTLEALMEDGLAVERDGRLSFTEIGRSMAEDIVRRHRLAERLLADVLTMPEDALQPNACRLEHILTRDVEQAICTLLGHPEACPHGSPIPRGRCCSQELAETGPIVVPLSSLRSGDKGSIAYLSPINRPELHKFLSMGLVPGVPVSVQQTFPAFVISALETMLAMEPQLAQHIFIRRARESK